MGDARKSQNDVQAIGYRWRSISPKPPLHLDFKLFQFSPFWQQRNERTVSPEYVLSVNVLQFIFWIFFFTREASGAKRSESVVTLGPLGWRSRGWLSTTARQVFIFFKRCFVKKNKKKYIYVFRNSFSSKIREKYEILVFFEFQNKMGKIWKG